MRESMLGKILAGLMTLPDTDLGMLVDLEEKLISLKGAWWAKELKKFLRQEPCWVSKRKINWVSLASVTSDGRPGQAGICELEKSHYRVGNWAKDVMTKPAYVVTNGKVYKPVVLLGGNFEDKERVTWNIRKVAEEMHFITPPAELARLLRESVTDKMIEEMGLWALIVMHEPITDSLGSPFLLGVGRDGGGQWLHADDGGPGGGWGREGGFVFLAPQE